MFKVDQRQTEVAQMTLILLSVAGKRDDHYKNEEICWKLGVDNLIHGTGK
jgi:hypothetical protein